ncbi:hypothetical protein GCM10023219_02470 [Stakelama sediminis]|uniref:Secreted protein n=1 Tax=Stakelama sediminis TaxID=463200 RepID=A0A840Z0P9_9SPHN|nr:hypothetical protein [Stakelama sediminis]MBB5719310.1 hypothetical protein [Stakelama sediminis]
MITLTPVQIAIGLVVIAVLIGVAVMVIRRNRTAHLRDRFGDEYDRTVRDRGGASKAEAELAEREKRVAKFELRPLSASQRDDFVRNWQRIQGQFVDNPEGAVGHADVLLGDVMQARGYPVSDFEQRTADLSVDHGEVITNYRTAHAIAVRHARGEASTEDLRQAMIHYRALFDDLVNEPSGDATPDPRIRRIPEERIHD